MGNDVPGPEEKKPEQERAAGFIFQAPVDAKGAKFIAGDNTVIYESAGFTTQDLSQLLMPLLDAIKESQAPAQTQEVATRKVTELGQELAKGEKADRSVIDRLVENLVGLVPGAVTAVGTIFGQPVLAGLAGPVTQALLKTIQK